MEANTSELPLNRSRDDGAPGAERPTPSLEKDKDVWLDDGNVILASEAGSKWIGFRLYKGLLSQRCEVFRDMFSVCDASQAGEWTFEGCPVIVVHDAPTDIRRLLMFVVNRE